MRRIAVIVAIVAVGTLAWADQYYTPITGTFTNGSVTYTNSIVPTTLGISSIRLYTHQNVATNGSIAMVDYAGATNYLALAAASAPTNLIEYSDGSCPYPLRGIVGQLVFYVGGSLTNTHRYIVDLKP